VQQWVVAGVLFLIVPVIIICILKLVRVITCRVCSGSRVCAVDGVVSFRV
jgi:hypothetical protein